VDASASSAAPPAAPPASKSVALVASAEPAGPSLLKSAGVASTSRSKSAVVASSSPPLDEVSNVRCSTRHTGKFCGFHCGAEFGVTADPVQADRASIRWAYEHAATESDVNSKGGADYWCTRAYAEECCGDGGDDSSATSRQLYQQSLSADHSKLEDFLANRKKVIDRAVKKLAGKREKRRGSLGRMLSFLWGSQPLVTCPHLRFLCSVGFTVFSCCSADLVSSFLRFAPVPPLGASGRNLAGGPAGQTNLRRERNQVVT
jgi:hypothetical protein